MIRCNGSIGTSQREKKGNTDDFLYSPNYVLFKETDSGGGSNVAVKWAKPNTGGGGKINRTQDTGTGEASEIRQESKM